LFVDEGLLNWVELTVLHQALQGDDGYLARIGDSHLARLLGLTAINHHAGSALLQTAAKLWSMQTQLITQNI
jgi:hypothetical protein